MGNNDDGIGNMEDEGNRTSEIPRKRLRQFVEEKLPKEELVSLQLRYRQSEEFQNEVEQFQNSELNMQIERQGKEAFDELQMMFPTLSQDVDIKVEEEIQKPSSKQIVNMRKKIQKKL